MSDLTAREKRKLERLFGMASGYVLDFSNRTFEGFILDTTGRCIYDAKYDYASGSKANRLRAFWNEEPNHVVGHLLGELVDYAQSEGTPCDAALVEDCLKVVSRLKQAGNVSDMDALAAVGNERDFETIASATQQAIENNQPEAGLDRLHTFTMKFVRSLCTDRGIPVSPDKALHSLFGAYVKQLRQGDHIESEMTERILKSSISTLEAFNHVRNNQSLAHDNPLLNYDEALLIFNHVASSVRFLNNLEKRLQQRTKAAPLSEAPGLDDDIPF